MITEKEFRDLIFEKLSNIKDSEIKFKKQEIVKNNNITKYGIAIDNVSTEDSYKLQPILYTDFLLADYNNGEADIDEIANNLYDRFMELSKDNTNIDYINEIANIVKDYDNVKDKLKIRLINREKNKDINAIKRDFLDLSKTLYFEFINNNELGGILVTKELFNNWGISEDKAFKQAYSNIVNEDKISFNTLSSFSKRFMKKDSNTDNDTDISDIEKVVNDSNAIMNIYVLSNKNRYYGASEMLNKNILNRITNALNEDIIIIPSSVHEVIIISNEYIRNKKMTYNDIKEMVSSINKNNVDTIEVLSDNIYKYSADDNEISIINT